MIWYFPRGELIVKKVKNPNAFCQGVILRTRVSAENSPGWIQPRQCLLSVSSPWWFIQAHYC